MRNIPEVVPFETEKQLIVCPHANCNKTFKERGNLNTHIRIHVNNN